MITVETFAQNQSPAYGRFIPRIFCLCCWCLFFLSLLGLNGCTRLIRQDELPPAWSNQEQALLAFAAGQFADAKGDLRAAVAFYWQTLRLDPKALSVRRYLVSDLLRLGKPEEAITQFRPIVDKNPDDIKNQYLLGQLYEAVGDTGTAEKIYLRARRQAPGDSGIATALGILMLKADREAEGRRFLEQALQLNSGDREARRTMVKYLLSRGRADAAVDLLQAALQADSEDREWLSYLAKVLSHQGKNHEAFLQYQKLLALDPDDAETRRLIADYYLEHRQWREAASELEWLLKADPGNFLIKRNLGLAYYELGDVDRARLHLQPLAEQETADALTHFLMGSIYRQKRLWRLAVQEFAASIALDPNNVTAYLEEAQILLNIGENASAASLMEIAGQKISSGSPQVLGQYGLLLLELNRPMQAREAFSQALRADPKNADLLFQFGRASQALNQFEAAVQAWERAVKLNPKMAEAYNHLGYAYAERNLNLDQALLWVRKALALDPKDENYHDSLGWVFYRQGKYSQALQEIKLALQLAKEAKAQVDPVILDHLGDVYLALGQPALAESTWQLLLKDNPGNLEIRDKIKKLHEKNP